MEASKEQELNDQLEMHRDLVKKLRINRKYHVLGGFLIGVGFWGLVIMCFD